MAARMTVTDTGVGIPTDRLGDVFNRFEQADASITRRFGGTGLGLSISRKIIEAMEGTVSVDSFPGAGSVFSIALNLPTTQLSPKGKAPTLDVESSALVGLQVLLAEDVMVNRELIALFLRPLGVELHMVGDGAEAVEAAAARPFDVILMDMQMPRLDGLEATRRIRSGGGPCAGVPILALTANVLPAEVERCRAAGMIAHISKPLSAERLATALIQALPSRELLEARRRA